MNKFRISFAAFLLTATLALAGSGWHKVADLDAGGDGKEVAVNRNCSVCLVKVTDGTVIINTIVVREGDKKSPISVSQRIGKGDARQVNVGDKKYVTGLRIGDDGRGHYEVYVK
jgi:hypothetical protein